MERVTVQDGGQTGRLTFERALRLHRREIYGVILKLTGNPEDAADLTQQTFLNAWRSWDRFEGRSSERTWLYSIALNLVRSRGVRKRETEPLDAAAARPAGESPLDRLVLDEDRREALQALRELPERQREAVALRIVQELSFAEAARAMGCSENAAKVNFHHGLKNLRKRLSKNA